MNKTDFYFKGIGCSIISHMVGPENGNSERLVQDVLVRSKFGNNLIIQKTLSKKGVDLITACALDTGAFTRIAVSKDKAKLESWLSKNEKKWDETGTVNQYNW